MSGIKKRGIASAFDAIFGDEAGESVPMALWRTLVPGTKELAHSVLMAMVDALCYGGGRQGYNSYDQRIHGASYGINQNYNYTGGYNSFSPSVGQNYSPNQTNPNQGQPMRSVRWTDYRNAYVDTLQAADYVIYEMKRQAALYERVDVAYFYQLCNITNFDAICRDYIWSKEKVDKIERYRVGGLWYFRIEDPVPTRRFV